MKWIKSCIWLFVFRDPFCQTLRSFVEETASNHIVDIVDLSQLSSEGRKSETVTKSTKEKASKSHSCASPSTVRQSPRLLGEDIIPAAPHRLALVAGVSVVVVPPPHFNDDMSETRHRRDATPNRSA